MVLLIRAGMMLGTKLFDKLFRHFDFKGYSRL